MRILACCNASARGVRDVVPSRSRAAPAAPIDVQILAINDFHGNLEPPKQSIDATLPGGAKVKVPAGGVAYMAGALKALRAGQAAQRHRLGRRHDRRLAAGVIALFLDEPTIMPR